MKKSFVIPQTKYFRVTRIDHLYLKFKLKSPGDKIKKSP
uniref:Uncharacterized protein n=1 Tax=Anguilla anguilla TaxID=7936 RepID=A0A0E9W039_ANGAN